MAEDLFRPVANRDDVYSLSPATGADLAAVLGAMMSRTGFLGIRWDQFEAEGELDPRNPPEKVRRFIDDNVRKYNHASIASMAEVFLYLYRFGWPASWILLDHPLFDGQEGSTRAVEGDAFPGDTGVGSPCRHAPAPARALHDRYMALYRSQGTGDGAWKQDSRRDLLPGTTPTGVVWVGDVRTIGRIADTLRGWDDPLSALADPLAAGLIDLSPNMAPAVLGKRRQPPSNWNVFLTELGDWLPGPEAGEGGLIIEPEFKGLPPEAFDVPEANAREHAREHLDPLWGRAPRLRVRIRTTIGCARDWHRHRPVMPWTLSLPLNDAGEPVLVPWVEPMVPDGLWNDTVKAWRDCGGERGWWSALHALPFGTMVELEAMGTLPAVLYMLELRARAPGAHPEYRRSAESGIRQLMDILPGEMCENLHIHPSATEAHPDG